MKETKVLKTVLVVLGLFLVAVGLGRLFSPVEAYSNMGLVLTDDVNWLNEARGVGGLMFALGVLIILGAFKSSLTFTSSIIAFLVFLSFGFARLIGLAIDGAPGSQLLQGLVFEFVFGFIALITFLKYRKKTG